MIVGTDSKIACFLFPEQNAKVERVIAEEKFTADDNQVVQKPRVVPKPTSPSPAEVSLHNLSHLPYRSWCPHCAAARRRVQAHASQAKSPHWMLPVIVFDYWFVEGASDETLVTVLVARLYPSRALFACVCDTKVQTSTRHSDSVSFSRTVGTRSAFIRATKKALYER